MPRPTPTAPGAGERTLEIMDKNTEIGLYRRYLRREDAEDIARRMARAIEVDAEVGGWFPELQALLDEARRDGAVEEGS